MGAILGVFSVAQVMKIQFTSLLENHKEKFTIDFPFGVVFNFTQPV